MALHPILSALLRNKTGPLLVAIQVALSLAILANALYIIEVRQAVAARPTGVAHEEQVFGLQVRQLVKGSHQEQIALQQRETATLRAVAGVVSVAAVTQSPLSRSGNYFSLFTAPGQTAPVAQTTHYVAADSLVQTWGLKLVEGRDFTATDYIDIDTTVSFDTPAVVIISQALARQLFPGAASVIGKSIYQGSGADRNAMRIIGVVERLQTPAAQTSERGEFSLIAPARLTGGFGADYTLRAEAGQRDRVMKEAEAAIRAASPTPLIVRSNTLQGHRQDRYRADYAMAWMLVTVSVLLLLITASGIVGMASLWVTQRRKQIGVRRALGARRVDILRYFLAENFMITSAGVVAGVLLGLGLNQLLVSQLELPRLPPVYLAGGAVMLWLLGIAAVYGPAWRAASISPATATRSA
ncbi:ABC transporter permease [Duganella sp. Leaf61]|uniref:ABC transporter permease n=1 Tax=Duganella sp. Leaf61 TaxID=1736227 RepID=UPI0006F7A70C|nr:FtsX-like permease family protein [Duganella sp. Leaf61]KQN76720.1 ABC transporter permease [Duganella sp. Leaf61]